MWQNPWVPSLPSFRPVPIALHSIPTGVPDIELRVSELFDFKLSEWQFDLLDTLFPAKSATDIANLPPLTLSRDDEWVWLLILMVFFRWLVLTL